MRYLIRHRTTYRYARPVKLQPHRLMLFPRSSHVLRVLDSKLHCTPGAKLERTQDVFGNLIVTPDFADPASQLMIESEFAVEQSAAE